MPEPVRIFSVEKLEGRGVEPDHFGELKAREGCKVEDMGWGVVDKDGSLVGVPFQRHEDAAAFAGHLNKAFHDAADLLAMLMRAYLQKLKSDDDGSVDWEAVSTTLGRMLDRVTAELAALRSPDPQVH